jgi:hypothetical protein
MSEPQPLAEAGDLVRLFENTEGGRGFLRHIGELEALHLNRLRTAQTNLEIAKAQGALEVLDSLGEVRDAALSQHQLQVEISREKARRAAAEKLVDRQEAVEKREKTSSALRRHSKRAPSVGLATQGNTRQ